MSDLKPALTAEEWGRAWDVLLCHLSDNFRNDREHMWLALYEDGTFALGNRAGDGFFSVENISVESRHRMAALALYGQPFGFTHEDVRDLRKQADALELSYALAAAFVPPSDHQRDTPAVSAMADRFRALADRIAALLPPEAP